MQYLTFTPEPSVVAGIAALQGLYWLCTGALLDRFPGWQPVSRGRKLVFSAGVLCLVLALASPLDELSDRYLFTAHMIQHLLLTLAVVPLLLAGTPSWLFAEFLRASRTLPFFRWVHHPLVAFGLFNVVFTLAHLPVIYDLALSNEVFHALEHLLFMACALVLWLPVISPAPKLLPPYPPLGQILYLFLQTVPASFLGAFLSNAPAASYPVYANAPRVFAELSPLADQQLGALLMWVGAGLYFLIATAIVFFAWASHEEAANRRPSGSSRPVPPISATPRAHPASQS